MFVLHNFDYYLYFLDILLLVVVYHIVYAS